MDQNEIRQALVDLRDKFKNYKVLFVIISLVSALAAGVFYQAEKTVEKEIIKLDQGKLGQAVLE